MGTGSRAMWNGAHWRAIGSKISPSFLVTQVPGAKGANPVQDVYQGLGSCLKDRIPGCKPIKKSNSSRENNEALITVIKTNPYAGRR